MPENNPFETFPESRPNSNLSAREKLFADMGLSPQGKPLEGGLAAEDFLNADFAVEENFISLTEPKAAEPKQAEHIEEEDSIVDAIFTSTTAQETPKANLVAETFAAEPTSHDSVLEELTAALQADPVTEAAELDELVITDEPLAVLEPVADQASAEPELKEEQPVVAEPAAQAASLVVLNSLDRAGFDPIVDAYTDLQKKLAANQALISAEREAIAALRNQMRQLNALVHDMSETRGGLDEGRQLVQADSCENLMRSISQVKDLIQQDSQRAVQLMTPIKAGVEILELRVKHVSAIESLLTHMQEGLKLQEQLAGADSLIHNLAKQLGLNFA